jgi:hypothetical protein
VENSYGPAVTRDTNAAQTWIKFDDIRSAWHLKKREPLCQGSGQSCENARPSRSFSRETQVRFLTRSRGW